MGIMIKYLFRNLREKKFRTFIAVMSIAISAALLFASTSVTDTVVQMYTDSAKRYTGDADLVVRPKADSPSPFFTVKSDFASETDYRIEAVEGSGTYRGANNDTAVFKTVGMRYEDMQMMNPFTLAASQALQPFTGKQAVISQNSATKYGLALGDALALDFGGGVQETFTVAGIAQPTGIFREYGTDAFLLVPINAVRDTMQLASDQINALYIKAQQPERVQGLLKDLAQPYDGYAVREAVPLDEINREIGTISGLFLMLTLIISLMSIFIIYSSFKVIAVERVNVMGVFRSIGATKRTTSTILLTESLLYGIIGGLLGCGLGIGLLYGMAAIANGSLVEGATVAVAFTPVQMLVAFLVAVLLCLISSLVPIVKAARMPLKEILLGKLENNQPDLRPGVGKTLFGLLLVPLGVGLPFLAPPDLALPLNLVAVIVLVLGLLALVPLATPLFAKLCGPLWKLCFGNEGVLAMKNLRGNKSVQNNISLLAVAIAILLMLNTVISGVIQDLTDFYKKSVQFDIMTQAKGMDSAFEQKIKDVDGVRDAYGVYAAGNVEVVGQTGGIGLIEGADPAKYASYWNLYMFEDTQPLLDRLDDGRNIILNNVYKDKFGVAEGDAITLKTKSGDQSYTVIGFVVTRMNETRYAIVSPQNLQNDMQLTTFSTMLVQTEDGYVPRDVAKTIRTEFQAQSPQANAMQDIADNDISNNSKLFLVLQVFLCLAVLVGVLSVMNNLLISFLERKRALAMLRSVGMSRKQMVKMIFVEALSTGLIGGLLGLGGGLAMATIMPHVVEALGSYIAVRYDPLVLVASFIAGSVVTMAASITPALKSSRMNIIESIRME